MSTSKNKSGTALPAMRFGGTHVTDFFGKSRKRHFDRELVIFVGYCRMEKVSVFGYDGTPVMVRAIGIGAI